jgi:hypothetical protein
VSANFTFAALCENVEVFSNTKEVYAFYFLVRRIASAVLSMLSTHRQNFVGYLPQKYKINHNILLSKRSAVKRKNGNQFSPLDRKFHCQREGSIRPLFKRKSNAKYFHFELILSAPRERITIASIRRVRMIYGIAKQALNYYGIKNPAESAAYPLPPDRVSLAMPLNLTAQDIKLFYKVSHKALN